MPDIRDTLPNRSSVVRTDLGETISDHLNLELISCDKEKGEYIMHTVPAKWMCNIVGIIHGGMLATLVDQAMGYAAFSSMPGDGFTPTIEMNVNYHRPVLPGDDILMKVKLKSVTKQLIHVACDVVSSNAPEKLCVSATAVYFYKPATETR